MIDAVTYGMIPSAKIEKRESAEPEEPAAEAPAEPEQPAEKPKRRSLRRKKDDS